MDITALVLTEINSSRTAKCNALIKYIPCEKLVKEALTYLIL
jgi:hypothetical protein